MFLPLLLFALFTVLSSQTFVFKIGSLLVTVMIEAGEHIHAECDIMSQLTRTIAASCRTRARAIAAACRTSCADRDASRELRRSAVEERRPANVTKTVVNNDGLSSDAGDVARDGGAERDLVALERETDLNHARAPRRRRELRRARRIPAARRGRRPRERQSFFNSQLNIQLMPNASVSMPNFAPQN
jgi:hypothetical protein